MRSRFEAFRKCDAAWLLASWHPSTRPQRLDLDSAIAWRALQIVDVVGGDEGAAEGVVEFRATFIDAGGAVAVHHERSRFRREDGRWYYVDAM